MVWLGSSLSRSAGGMWCRPTRRGAGSAPEAARYQDVLHSLRVAYDGRAEWRDQREKAPWKLAERELIMRCPA